MAYLTAIALAAAAIGTGISVYGQQQQAKTQNAIASFNAAQQEREARNQLLSLQTQAALQKQTAEANFKLRSAEAAAANRNAGAIERQALAQDAVGRVNMRKRAEEFARMQGEQRASIAASGVTESSGTPLDILAETAAAIQMDQEEQHYTGEVQRRTLFSEAANQRLGGKLALAGATLDRDSAVSGAALQAVSARNEYLGARRGAQITRLTGRAAKQAANYESAATLFSSAASIADKRLQYKAR